MLQLKDYNIGINISLSEEKFAEKISKTKLTQAQSDRLQDTKDTSELYTPDEIDKSVTHEDMDSFMNTLLIYGSCLKNLELLPKKEKKIMYNDYNFGLTIIFVKLLYYYRYRYFSCSLDSFFENILADINIKLHGGNKMQKDRIISELKKQKRANNI